MYVNFHKEEISFDMYRLISNDVVQVQVSKNFTYVRPFVKMASQARTSSFLIFKYQVLPIEDQF